MGDNDDHTSITNAGQLGDKGNGKVKGPQRGHRRRLKPATTSWRRVSAAERMGRGGRRREGPQRSHRRRLKPATTSWLKVSAVERMGRGGKRSKRAQLHYRPRLMNPVTAVESRCLCFGLAVLVPKECGHCILLLRNEHSRVATGFCEETDVNIIPLCEEVVLR